MKKLLLFLLILLGGAVATSLLDYGPFVIVNEGEQKIVLFLGEVRAVLTEPGVHLVDRVPVTVRQYDGRWLLTRSSVDRDIKTTDLWGVLVDNYAVWRIADPVKFYESFPSGVAEGERQIEQEVRSKIRSFIGQRTLDEILQGARSDIISEDDKAEFAGFGIEVKDVRINRTELPTDSEDKVYQEMRSDRKKRAEQLRAEGEERSEEIRSQADTEAARIRAEAREIAFKTRGDGRAKAAKTYADVFGADPEFYDFVRSLEAYRKTIGKGTTLVLPPDHAFFKVFQSGGVKQP